MSARDRFLRDLDELVRDYSPRARDLLVRDLDALLEDAWKEGDEEGRAKREREYTKWYDDGYDEGKEDAEDDFVTIIERLQSQSGCSPEQQDVLAAALRDVQKRH